MRKIFFFLLMIVALSACTDKAYINSVKNNQITIKENLLEDDSPSYKKERIDLPTDDCLFLHVAKTDGVLFFYGIDEPDNNLFYTYDISKNVCTRLDIDISGDVHSIDAAGDCLYILVDTKDDYFIYRYDISTHNAITIPLEKVIDREGGMQISRFSVVENRIYVSIFDEMYCFDDTGKMIAHIEMENIWNDPFRFMSHDSDSALIAYSSTNNNFVIQKLNSELQLICQYVLNSKYTGLFQGFSKNQIFLSDSNNIYSLDLETGDKCCYLNILHYNLDISNFIPISNESFFTTQGGIPTLWTVDDENGTNTTSTLKCATYDASYELQCAVSLFNFNHDRIKIDIVDYSVYNDGMTKLLVEMTAGKVPDILDLSAMPIAELKKSGMLQNLEEYLSEKDIVPNILKCLKSDNGLFEVVPGFQLVAMAGNSDYIPGQNINADDLLIAAEKANSEGKYLFPRYTTKEAFISYILSFSGDSFVDIENDYCNFEDETFASLLQYASVLPSNIDFTEQMYIEAIQAEYSEILEGNQLISLVETGNPIFELLKLKALYGDQLEIMGFPTNTGSGIAMTPFLRIAMSSTSDLKDEVEVFFDYLLSESFQAEMSKLSYMPVISEYLDNYINDIVEGYVEVPLKLAVPDAMILECPAVDNETARSAWSLIRQVDCMNEYDTNIYKIVLEECLAFFAGDKEVSEVIPIIQSRASLYVHEKQ